ncbi:Tn3 family transposase [Streptomyces finlayi]|uniref:Tn3 family transposase n=1 Tax=Streptomyces finlayi TaxID=67296 RepID=A0A7G7BD65_9ACTN|nr:Tn3 family transposase [Streptomyces finlayi]
MGHRAARRLDAVTSVSGGGSLSPEVLAERLLLVIYVYGTNTGIKAVAAGGHGHTEDELRYVRRRYLSAEAALAIAVQIANATFAARSTELWGQGSTEEEVPGHPLPTDQLHRLRGRRDDRGRDAARHHDGCRGQLHGLARPVGIRVRHHEAAELRPAAQDQADQQGEAVPAGGRRTGRLPAAHPGADPADPLGIHRPAVRPDDQVRPPRSGPAPRPPRRPCGASPATPPIPPTWRCWRSAARRRPSSWPATCGCGTSSGRSSRAERDGVPTARTP